MDRELFLYLLGCLVLGIVITCVGFYTGVSNFLPNFLSGWGQFFLELVVGLLVIDKFMERQHNKQWKRVRDIRYRILREHLVKFLNDICIEFNYIDISKNLMYKKKGISSLGNSIDSIIKELNYLDNQDDISHKLTFIKLYDNIKEELKEIRTSYIPQIMQNTRRQILADKLSELDLCFIRFEDDIMKCKHRNSANVNIGKVVSLIENIQDVLTELDK